MPRARDMSQLKCFVCDVFPFERTEVANQSTRQIISVEVLKAKSKPGQPSDTAAINRMIYPANELYPFRRDCPRMLSWLFKVRVVVVEV